jgi:hypothetical protein
VQATGERAPVSARPSAAQADDFEPFDAFGTFDNETAGPVTEVIEAATGTITGLPVRSTESRPADARPADRPEPPSPPAPKRTEAPETGSAWFSEFAN